MMKKVLVVLMAVVWIASCAHQSTDEVMSSDTPEMEQAVQAPTFEEKEGEVEVPPEGALPLSQIIASLEVGTHVSIIEVEFEDGAWEIEYVVGGEVHEILVDPISGEAIDDEADEAEKPEDD